MSDHDQLDKLADSVAPQLPQHARRSLAVQLLGGTSEDLGHQGTDSGAITTALTVEERIDQARLTTSLSAFLPGNVLTINGGAATRASAVYNQSTSRTAGFAEDHVDAAIITNATNMDAPLQEVLSEIIGNGTYTTGDGKRISVDIPLVLLGTPSHRSWDEYESIIGQIGYPLGLLAKTDIFSPVTDSEQRPPTQPWETDEIQEYLDDHRPLTPGRSAGVDTLIDSVCSFDVPESDSIRESFQPLFPTPTHLRQRLRRVATALTKARDGQTVRNTDVGAAASLVFSSYAALHSPLPSAWEEFVPEAGSSGEFDASEVGVGGGEADTGEISDATKGRAIEIIQDVDREYENCPGAPREQVLTELRQDDTIQVDAEAVIEALKISGSVYFPDGDHIKSI